MAKILIVDDDIEIRKLLSAHFMSKGYEVVTGENGKEGVSLAAEEKPDLIIMDLNMPVMDGFLATKEIKTSSETGTIPIIVLSAENAEANLEEIYAAGADGFVPKPLDIPRLLARAAEFITT